MYSPDAYGFATGDRPWPGFDIPEDVIASCPDGQTPRLVNGVWTHAIKNFAAIIAAEQAQAAASVTAVKTWEAYEFLLMLAPGERIAIRNLAVTDAVAKDFMHLLDSAIASKAIISSSTQNVVDGLNYLCNHNCIDQTRVDLILK